MRSQTCIHLFKLLVHQYLKALLIPCLECHLPPGHLIQTAYTIKVEKTSGTGQEMKERQPLKAF